MAGTSRTSPAMTNLRCEHGTGSSITASSRYAVFILCEAHRVAHRDPLAAGLFHIEVTLQHRLHVLEHGIEVVAIDGRIVVAVGLREAMRKISAAAGVHELA